MITFCLLIVFFGIGVGLQYSANIPEKIPQQLNKFVINIAFPAMILLNTTNLTLSSNIIFPIASYWFSLLAAWFIASYSCQRFGWGRDIQCVMFVMIGHGNTSFLGFPMVEAFFSSHNALGYALIYDQLGSFLGLSLVATVVVAAYSSKQAIPKPHQLLLRVITFPPFIALMAGLLLPLHNLIITIEPLLNLLAQLIIPSTMLAVGLQCRFNINKQDVKPLATILVSKMLLLPIAVAIAGIVFSINPLVSAVTIFETATPPMITAAALLMSANIATRLVVATLGLGTLLSFITLPLLGIILN